MKLILVALFLSLLIGGLLYVAGRILLPNRYRTKFFEVAPLFPKLKYSVILYAIATVSYTSLALEGIHGIVVLLLCLIVASQLTRGIAKLRKEDLVVPERLAMKKSLKRILAGAGVAALVLLLAGGYVVYRISKADEVVQVSPEENTLKPGAIEIAGEVDHQPYLDYLRSKAHAPVEYVVEKLHKHDVVLLGEQHEIHENCQFVSDLIEPAYRRGGARMFIWEFLKQKRSSEVNDLLNADAFDENRIVQIFREDYLYWGFQEYIDILKSIWTLNHSLAKGEPPLQVAGMAPDIDVYKAMCGTLWQKLPQFLSLLGGEEQAYAAPIESALQNNQKALVQLGYAHTFWQYKQANIVNGKMLGEFTRKRMARLLKDKYGDRIFQVSLHVRQDQVEPYNSKVETPLVMFLEVLYADNGNTAVGFDVSNSPFALLRDTTSDYFKFQRHVTLSDIAQGYILLKPINQLSCVKWIPGFVDDSNFQQLRSYALQRDYIAASECNSPVQLDERFSSMLKHGKRLN